MSTNSVFESYILEHRTYADGETIIEEGSMDSRAYVVMKGTVKVRKRTAKSMVTIDTLKEGEVFGEMVFLEGGEGRRSASVTAVEGSVHVGLLDNERLVAEYEALPPELRVLIVSLMIKLRNTTSNACSVVVAR
jgi:CRP-like cAMP-binding protein